MGYDAFKKWYMDVKGMAAATVGLYLVAFRKVKFSSDGKTIDEITSPDDFSERVKALIELKGTPEEEFKKVFTVEKGNLQFDDLKGGLRYYLEFLGSNRNGFDDEGKGGDKNVKAEELAKKLEKSYNIILRGAPGTGKTYLAKEIAAKLIGISKDGLVDSDQFEFVQFHPSYDYTDFVEGLRPIQVNGQVGFEPRDGTFKAFCTKAKMQQEPSFEIFDGVWEKFIDDVLENDTVTIPRAGEDSDDIIYSVNSNRNLKDESTSSQNYSITKENIFRVWQGRKGRKSGAHQSRMKAVLKYLEANYNLPKYEESATEKKKYVFVIDEINRGEISKIFGELFFSIDPEYRGTEGAVSTQYANLFENEEKFYIPENVYIIGTMNDIDRSVDTFDFAMRRRFTFEELTAEDSQVMLSNPSVIELMNRVNNAIVSDEIGLTSDYQIGGSYFKALDNGEVDEEELWKNKLKPLLKDYFRSEREAEKKLENIENAYKGDADDSAER